MLLHVCQSKDIRDKRPMNYPARLLSNPVHDMSFFRKTKFFAEGRCDPVNQAHSREMEHLESMDPKTLPSFAETDGLVHGAQKYAQIGVEASRKILDALVARFSASANDL